MNKKLLKVVSLILLISSVVTGIGAFFYPDQTGIAGLGILVMISLPLLILWVVSLFMMREKQ